MPVDANLQTAQRGRWALAALFLLNGVLMGSWVIEIPQFIPRFGITEKTIGLLIMAFGVGALCMMPVAGAFMARYGSRRVLLVFSVLCIFALLPIAYAPTLAALTVAVFVMGMMTGSMDVAMNSNAVAVEKALSKAIMSSSHGFWSLGGFLGGSIGGYVIQNYGFRFHIIGVCIVLALIFLVSFRHVLPDAPVEKTVEEKQPLRLPTSPGIYLVGLVALFAMVPEGAVMDWSSVYLQRQLGADIATGSLAYSFFAGTMAALRFAGDGVRNRFGAVNTMRASSLIAAVGIATAALSSHPWVAIFAFAFAGIGIANIVPIAFSAAGNQPGVASAVGMSIVTTIGYSGLLLAPSIVGYLVEHIGFSQVYLFLAAMLIIVCAAASLVRAADFKPTPPLPGPEVF